MDSSAVAAASAAAAAPLTGMRKMIAGAAAAPGSPIDTYAISDHDGSTDEDEEEDPANNGKHVPPWARGDALKTALERQCEVMVDPDTIFDEVSTCDLSSIFDNSKKVFKKRTSSAHWDVDKVTMVERRNYRKDMGFAQAAAV